MCFQMKNICTQISPLLLQQFEARDITLPLCRIRVLSPPAHCCKQLRLGPVLGSGGSGCHGGMWRVCQVWNKKYLVLILITPWHLSMLLSQPVARYSRAQHSRSTLQPHMETPAIIHTIHAVTLRVSCIKHRRAYVKFHVSSVMS